MNSFSAASSPPLDEGLDERGVALAGRQVKQSHSSEGLGVDEMFGLGPAGPTHHLLTHHHHAALEGAAGLVLTR